MGTVLNYDHERGGNCFAESYNCTHGCGNTGCDVCHEHDEPRGACSQCPGCGECEKSE